MPDKDKSSKTKWVAPKSTPTPTPSQKVDFGNIRHAAHLKKTILKMNDEQLKAYSKQIEVPFNGNQTDFLWPAINKYNSQQ
tara:strand:+ start:1219 stop:1461 length:243 start_codon:yes stop_codon:yes gene_type:complete